MDKPIIRFHISLQRKLNGMKQQELAKLIGCSPAELSKIERGIVMPKFDVVVLISKIFKVDINELFST